MAGDLNHILGRWRSGAEGKLDRILATRWGRRFDPYLGLGELRRVNPLLGLIPMALLFVFGLVRSEFGHMDTVPAIFPIMALISGLNPFVGILSGLAYGLGDLLQKFVVDDVFYEGVRTAGDYWGARAGYLIAYSALILFGILPGVLSRAGRRIALRVTADQRGGGGLPVPGPVGAGVNVVAGLIGAVIGGAAGSLAAAAAWKGAVAPAFLLRPSPDHSCHALSGSNVIHAIPSASVAGGVGGGVGTAIPALGAVTVPGVAPFPVPPLDVAGPLPSGQMAPPIPPPLAPPTTGGPPAPAGPGPTEGVVVSGPEAVGELIDAGFPTVKHGGRTFVKPPTGVGGPISAVGHGGLITLPTGEQVLDPNSVVIVKNVPKLTGPTTTVQGPGATGVLINEGFPTYTDPSTGRIYVRHPPNLIHGNVGGIAFEGTTIVNGVEVLDPNKGIIVHQTGPPSAPPVVPTVATTPVSTPTTPVVTPPVVTTPPAPPVVTPPVTPPVVQVPVVQPPPPPQPPPQPPPDPPRTPTDGKSLVDSLTKPGTTVITPDNLPGFAPDILTPDGKIIAKGPKVPDPLKKLDGVKVPTPVIRNGTVSLDLPMTLGNAKVTLSVKDGRIQADTRTSGGIAAIEGASELLSLGGGQPIDVGRSVQRRLDRYNDEINKVGLEVKGVIADGGQIQVITGPRS